MASLHELNKGEEEMLLEWLVCTIEGNDNEDERKRPRSGLESV